MNKEKEEYKYGFKNEDVSTFKTDVGLNEDIIREISHIKNEPEWMLEFRLKSYRAFKELPLPSYGPDLTNLDLTLTLLDLVKKKRILGTKFQKPLKKLSKNLEFLKPNKSFYQVYPLNMKVK